MASLRGLIATLYRWRMKFSKRTGWGMQIKNNTANRKAPVSFYDLSASSPSGGEIIFETYRGKKILLVNLASRCGFTPQYAELEQLHRQNTDWVVLGFPSNNFGSQEPGSDEEIAAFCQLNYGVTFPVFNKGDVKGPHQQPVYQWLTDPAKNGWNTKEPQWNFYKYLVGDTGNLLQVYSSSVSPLDIPLAAAPAL